MAHDGGASAGLTVEAMNAPTSPRVGTAPRVALFATCLADRFFADACADTVHVLRHLGVPVDVPTGQTCCGQPAYNTGNRDQAVRMARHTLAVFEGADYVVLPSGSCAGMIRSFYGGLLEPEAGGGRASHTAPGAPAGADASPGEAIGAAAALAARTWELSQFLVHVLGATEGPGADGLTGRRVAYHHGCHALRELGAHDEPLALLRGCGADVVPWEGDTECCGFGGLFSTKFPEVSAGMADRKLDVLPEVDVVTSADGGCLLQLAGRAARRDHERGPAPPGVDGVRHPTPPFVHLATLLREGFGA